MKQLAVHPKSRQTRRSPAPRRMPECAPPDRLLHRRPKPPPLRELQRPDRAPLARAPAATDSGRCEESHRSAEHDDRRRPTQIRTAPGLSPATRALRPPASKPATPPLPGTAARSPHAGRPRPGPYFPNDSGPSDGSAGERWRGASATGDSVDFDEWRRGATRGDDVRVGVDDGRRREHGHGHGRTGRALTSPSAGIAVSRHRRQHQHQHQHQHQRKTSVGVVARFSAVGHGGCRLGRRLGRTNGPTWRWFRGR